MVMSIIMFINKLSIKYVHPNKMVRIHETSNGRHYSSSLPLKPFRAKNMARINMALIINANDPTNSIIFIINYKF